MSGPRYCPECDRSVGPVKVCTGCGKAKPVTEFYWSRGSPRPRCKVCFNAESKSLEYYYANKEECQAKHREWAEKNRGRCRKYGRDHYRRTRAVRLRYRHENRDPQKERAHDAVRRALRNGTLVRRPCQGCGGMAESHHKDYSKPLEVTWLCSSCHKRLHAEVARV